MTTNRLLAIRDMLRQTNKIFHALYESVEQLMLAQTLQRQAFQSFLQAVDATIDAHRGDQDVLSLCRELLNEITHA